MFSWANIKAWASSHKLFLYSQFLIYWIYLVPSEILQEWSIIAWISLISFAVGMVFMMVGLGLGKRLSLTLYDIYSAFPTRIHDIFGQPSLRDDVLQMRSCEKALDNNWTKIIVDGMPFTVTDDLREFMKENGTYCRYYISTMETESEELRDMVDALGKSEVYIEDEELAFLYKMTH